MPIQGYNAWIEHRGFYLTEGLESRSLSFEQQPMKNGFFVQGHIYSLLL